MQQVLSRFHLSPHPESSPSSTPISRPNGSGFPPGQCPASVPCPLPHPLSLLCMFTQFFAPAQGIKPRGAALPGHIPSSSSLFILFWDRVSLNACVDCVLSTLGLLSTWSSRAVPLGRYPGLLAPDNCNTWAVVHPSHWCTPAFSLLLVLQAGGCVACLCV